MTTNPALPLIRSIPLHEAVRGILGSLVAAAGGAMAGRPAEATDQSAWVRAAQAGDPDAFRKLVDRYRDRALETALRIVRDREEAEEVTQDAFVRAWRALPGFRGDARFSTWLYRIVTRRAIDRVETLRRRRDRETATEPVMLETVAAAETTALPSTALRRLDRVLAELDAVPRATVTLYYLRERSIAEIADILELPQGTVKTHLHRSRAALRQAWQREERREGSDGLPRL